MTAFAVSLLLAAPLAPTHTVILLGGVGSLLVLGTIDDRRTLSPQLRVACEFAVGMLLPMLGLGWHLGAGHVVDALVNAVWVVAVVNAFNLFDNMDGAASTMAIVAAAGACTLGWLRGDAWAVAASAALCGACLGFLPHNLARPARIFLGDGGSLPIGFAVAALVASAARGAEPSVLGLVTGMLLVGVPALDTCLVIISRRRRGVSILTGGQDHLTHRARRRGLTARRVALVLGSLQALLSALVIVATRASSATLVYVLLAFVVCAAVAIVGLEQAAAAQGVPATGAVPAVATGRISEPWSERISVIGLALMVSAPASARSSRATTTPACGLFSVSPSRSPPRRRRWRSAPGSRCRSRSRSWGRGARPVVLGLHHLGPPRGYRHRRRRPMAHPRRSPAARLGAPPRAPAMAVPRGAAGIGIALVAASVVARMNGGDPGALLWPAD